MKINITNKEYKALLTMVAIGAWVIEAHQVEERQETRPIRELEQKIMALAGEFGCGHLVHYDKEGEDYEPSDEFRVKGDFHRHLVAYEENIFWDELIDRLAHRDAFSAMTDQEYEDLDVNARFGARQPHRERWVKEFEIHGLDRLEIAAKPRRQKREKA
jgi:hypothetical protein